MNAIPMDIPPGPRYGRGSTQMASASSSSARTTVQVAQLPVPPAPAPIPAAPPPPVMTASAAEGPKGSSRFRLIPTANAGTLPVVHGGPTTGTWAIQVGAFGNEEQAHAAIAAARDHAKEPLGKGKTVVAAMAQPKGKLYRARVTGLSRDAAMQACEKLGHKSACIVLSPDAQS
jgi:cell division septation protein DedD